YADVARTLADLDFIRRAAGSAVRLLRLTKPLHRATDVGVQQGDKVRTVRGYRPGRCRAVGPKDARGPCRHHAAGTVLGNHYLDLLTRQLTARACVRKGKRNRGRTGRRVEVKLV